MWRTTDSSSATTGSVSCRIFDNLLSSSSDM